MAGWENLLTSPPAPNRMTTLADFYRPPTTQDMLAVAAFGDEAYGRKLNNRLKAMALQDELDRRQADLDRVSKFSTPSAEPPAQAPQTAPPAPRPAGTFDPRSLAPGQESNDPFLPGYMGIGGQRLASGPAGQNTFYQPGSPWPTNSTSLYNGSQPVAMQPPQQQTPGGAPATTAQQPQYGASGEYGGAAKSQDRDLAMAKERMASLVQRAQQAIATGDNDALQQVLAAAKADPYVAKLIPKDLNINVAGDGRVSMAHDLDVKQLRDLSFKAAHPVVRRQIMEARAGRPYEYTMKNGKVAEFRPIAMQDAGALGRDSGYGTTPARTGLQGATSPDVNKIEKSKGFWKGVKDESIKALQRDAQVAKAILNAPDDAMQALLELGTGAAAFPLSKLGGLAKWTTESFKKNGQPGAKAAETEGAIQEGLTFRPSSPAAADTAAVLGTAGTLPYKALTYPTSRAGDYATKHGYPNLGYALKSGGEDVAAMLLPRLESYGGEAVKKASAPLADRDINEKVPRAGNLPAGREEGARAEAPETRGVPGTVAKGAEKVAEGQAKGRQAGVPSGAQVEWAILHGDPVSAEDMARYPELLKKHERDFVRTSKGNTDFGVLPKEVLPEGLTPGPIRLQRGAENSKARFGEYHLEKTHGKDIRDVGYSSARDFVEDTVQGATEVWGQRNGRLLIVKKNGEDHIAIVEFEREGPFYNIKTAFPTRDIDYASKHGRWLLHKGRPLGSYWGNK